MGQRPSLPQNTRAQEQDGVEGIARGDEDESARARASPRRYRDHIRGKQGERAGEEGTAPRYVGTSLTRHPSLLAPRSWLLNFDVALPGTWARGFVESANGRQGNKSSAESYVSNFGKHWWTDPEDVAWLRDAACQVRSSIGVHVIYHVKRNAIKCV